VRILDLSKKKQIADFELRNPVDATIFDVVDQIANRIVKEAAAVLPSKDDMARGRFREEIPTLNQLSLRGQFAPLAFSANQTVSAAGQHAGTDFSKVAAVALDFHHFGIFKEQLGVFIGGSVRSASNEFRYAIDGSVVPVSLQSFVGQGGIAWRQKLTPKFYLQPFLGGGVQYDTMKFNYDSQTVAVSNTTGQPLSAREYALFSPFACAGLRFGYAINSWLMLETGALYAMSFFQGATGQSLFAELGVGFRL
ncbi:MAG: hypothetical protein NZL89_05965, partial [Leptospiraceae bacterium]|nr:hypothetical protein [Leptospiraceae bacterium]